MRRSLPLITTLTVEAGAVLVLYRFIQEPGLAVPIAFGCAAWLLGTTVLYLGARLAQVPAAVSAVGRVTLPALRRRVDRAVAASILTGALVATGSPALAAADPLPAPAAAASAAVAKPEPSPEVPSVPSDPEAPPETEPPVDPPTTASTIPVRSGRAGDPAAVVAESTVPERAITDPTEPATTATTTKERPAPHRAQALRRDPASAPGGTPAVSTPLPAVSPTIPASTSYTVVRGDSFWEIAARHLASATGRDRTVLTATDITAYWVRLCDANRDHVRSGDVNLVYAGEVIVLPTL